MNALYHMEKPPQKAFVYGDPGEIFNKEISSDEQISFFKELNHLIRTNNLSFVNMDHKNYMNAKKR